MNKKLLDNLAQCIDLILTSDLGLDIQYVSTVRLANEALIQEFNIYMEALASMAPHLSEVQASLLSLVIDEYKLNHLPKLEDYLKVIKKVENNLNIDKSTIH